WLLPRLLQTMFLPRLFSFIPGSAPLALLSFPTRRSSDLAHAFRGRDHRHDDGPALRRRPLHLRVPRAEPARRGLQGGVRVPRARSEEHTSELQSRENLVCRLLLEKKIKTFQNIVNRLRFC